METIDLRKGHEVFSENKYSEWNRLKLQVTFISEQKQGKHHDDGGLETGFPDPSNKVQQRKIVSIL